MKFLVFWTFQPGVKAGPEVAKAIFDLRDYAAKLKNEGKLDAHYHLVGKHGGVWVLEVDSNDELERLLAQMPVYNHANYEIFPLTEMKG